MPTMDRLIQGLALASSSMGIIPVIGPQAKELLELVIKICQMAEDVRSNTERWKLLAEHAAKLVEELLSVLKTMSAELLSQRQAEVEELLVILNEIAKAFEARTVKGTVARWWDKDADEEEAMRLQSSLGNVITRFGVLAQVRAAGKLDRLEGKVDIVHQFVVTNARSLRPTFAEGERGLLLELKPTYEAHFDHGNARPGCLKHTREAILEDIYKWIDDPHAPEIIRWLAGLAGTGKSTIAQTICETLATSGRLGASFFFSRNSEEQRQQGSVIRTIAFQLAHVSPHLKSLVLDAMRNNVDIVTRSMQQQALLLIAGPLSTATDIPSPLVFVFDALDECEGEGDRLIPLLAHTLKNLASRVQCKIFVTSRLEQSIRGMFNTIDHRAYKLHEVEASLVDSDIRRYFVTCFAKIAANRPGLNLDNWPSEDEMSILVARAGRLFIYAATVVKYVDVKGASPRARLAAVLAHDSGISSLPFRQVDDVYLHILESACKIGGVNDEERTKQVRMVAGTVVLLSEPLPKAAMCVLNATSGEDIEDVLEGLHAVLVLPDKQSSDQAPVRILHPSFADFIITPSRCTNRRLLVDSEERHTSLVIQCLEVMDGGLKRDICNIRDPSLLNSEVPKLSARVAQAISPALAYACKYWLSHLRHASASNALLAKSVQKFAKMHLLNWIEACSLLECLPTILSGLRSLSTWPTTSTDWVHSRALIRDAERLILDFFPSIRTSALHVHYSAAPLLPACTLQKQYSDVISGAPCLITGHRQQWNATLQVIEGHFDGVASMTLSADNRYLVSGSFDHTVRVWDAATGASVTVLEGHTDTVWSVAISLNGSRVLSGGQDGIVRVWDTITGACSISLEDESASVNAVAISPDGSHYASASQDSILRVWNAKTSELTKKFITDTSGFLTLEYFPDGLRLISGSFDYSVRIWDSITGGNIFTLCGHTDTVRSVTISHDSSMVASASDDATLRIWSPVSGVTLKVLRGHSGGVKSVTFSPDNIYLVSGGEDGTVRVWNVETGAAISTLAGHTRWVSSVAISSDRTRIFSAADDFTIRVWEISSTTEQNAGSLTHEPIIIPDRQAALGQRKGRFGIRHRVRSAIEDLKNNSFRRSISLDTVSIRNTTPHTTDRVLYFAVSQDHSVVITGHYSGSIHLHKANSLGNFTTKVLGSHEGMIYGVTYSVDAEIAASCADDSVYIWDVQKSRRIRKSTFKSTSTSVAISPDGLTLVVGTVDGPVMLWKVNTWVQQPSLNGHENQIWSLAFSPDGSRIVSGSHNGSIRIWSAHTRACLSVLDGGGPIAYVCFTPDVSQLGSVTSSGVVRTWDVLAQGARRLDNHRPAFFHIDESGWLFGPLPSDPSIARRLCWVPSYRRKSSPWDFWCYFSSGKVTLVSDAGLITRLDVSNLLSFVSSLD